MAQKRRAESKEVFIETHPYRGRKAKALLVL